MSIGIGSLGRNRQQQRMEPNPLDKCTIVSAFPKVIVADKPTISPGNFIVPKAAVNDFAILVIGTSSWWKSVSEDEPLLEVPCSSFQVANAIVNDFIGATLAVRGQNQKPAVFFVLGEFDKETIKAYKDKTSGKTFDMLLSEALKAQDNWYNELVRIADSLWARHNGNPLAIPDDARIAAERLNIAKNKAWMQDFKTSELKNCHACGHMVNPMYPICPNCKTVINEAKAKELGIKFSALMS